MNDLRQDVRLLKALNNISYTALAQELGIKPSSFYNWMRGNYQFSSSRRAQLQNIIEKYREVSI